MERDCNRTGGTGSRRSYADLPLHAAQCSGWEADGRVSHPLRADPDPRRSEDQTDIDSRYGVTTVTTVTTSVVASQGRHGRHGCHGLKGKIGAKRPPKGLAV